MTALGGLIGFIVHALLIWWGAKIAKIEQASFIMSLVVALASYVVMLVLTLLLFPLWFVPVLNSLLSAAVLLVGTSVAAKFLFNCKWEPAWTIAFVVAVVNLILGLIF
ncbi:hypothetical protein JW859_00675 [bacterium]|nr:hypothetical protein [bacterium]